MLLDLSFAWWQIVQGWWGKIRRNDWLFFTLWHSKFIASNNFVIRERSTYTKADKTYHFLSISTFSSRAGVAASLHNLLFCVQQLVICRMRYIIPPIMLLSLIFDGRIIDFFPFWKSPKPTLQTRGTRLVIVLHPFYCILSTQLMILPPLNSPSLK